MNFKNDVQLNFGKYLVEVLPIYTTTFSRNELTLVVPSCSIYEVLLFFVITQTVSLNLEQIYVL